MGSFVAETTIRNNRVTGIGTADLGVRWIDDGPPQAAGITVLLAGAPDSVEHEVPLGGTFPIGEETWRFERAEFDSADEWTVFVRRVDEDVPPWQPPAAGTPRWQPIDLRPYGTLDEARIAGLEAELGHRLPPRYRSWLAGTNGAQPVGEHTVPGLPFALFEERPLLGVHPQYPPFDLAEAERQHRRPWLPEGYVVIAVPSGGLLAVGVAGTGEDVVLFLPDAAKAGPATPEAAAMRERQLIPVGQDIGYFLGRLQPMAPPPGPPATLSYPTA